MRRITFGGSLLLCAWISLGVACPAVGQKVGKWGDPERIVIRGAKHWTADEIRDVLVADIDAVVAGHPAAKLSDYPAVLAARVREGYLAGGFAHAEVTARLDADARKIEVTIDEGPQFLAGEIEVQNTQHVDAAAIATWLKMKQPDSSARVSGFDRVDGKQVPRWVDKNGKKADLSAATWKPGKPVSFTKDEQKPRETAVRRALEEQGFHRAEFTVSLVRDEAAHTVRLVVAIENEGEPSKVDRVEVTGSERDTQDDVIKFLDIQPGQIVTETLRSAWVYKLWMSGRYFEHGVTLARAKDGDDAMVLQIKLVDYKKAPPLRNPLTADEQLVLKCRESVLAALDRGDAFLVRGDLGSATLDVAMVKNDGILCLVAPAAAPADKQAGESSENEHGANAALSGPVLFAGKPGELLHAFSGGKQLLRAPITKARIIVALGVEPDLDPKNEKQKFKFMLNAGLTTKRDTVDALPVAASLSLAPVAMLGMLHQDDHKATAEGGVLTIGGGDTTYRIDQESGRLLSCTMDLSDEDEKIKRSFTLTIEPRSFADCLADAERRLAPGVLQQPNAYQAARPLASSLEFLLDSPVCDWFFQYVVDETKDKPRAADREIVKKLLAADLLRPLETWLAQPDQPAEQKFSIPLTMENAQANPGIDALLLGMGRLAAGLVIHGAEQTFPRDSWPWTLSRGGALFVMQKTQFAGDDLTALYNSEDVGPVGRLVTALLLEYVSGEMAAKFAESGVNKLTWAGFTADYRPFLDREKYAGQVLLKAAEMLREFSDEEAEELGQMLLGKDSKLIVVAVQYLREHKEEPIEQSLTGMLHHVWDNGLSDLVAARLKDVYLRNFKLVREKKKGTL